MKSGNVISARDALQNNCPLTSLFFPSFSVISLLLLIPCQAFEFSFFFFADALPGEKKKRF